MTRLSPYISVVGLFAAASVLAASAGLLNAQAVGRAPLASVPVAASAYSSSLSDPLHATPDASARLDLSAQLLPAQLLPAKTGVSAQTALSPRQGSIGTAAASGALAANAALPSYHAGPDTRPFHSVALAFVVGIQGIGVEAATPLASWINLRGGAQLLGVSASFTSDGLQGNGQLSLENVYTSVDFYPFRRSSFHLSPGITLHNDTHITANLLAPGGSTFSLGDQDYTSDPTDPIQGLARFTLGKSVAPRFTIGWGNMIPRNGSHFSFPFEVGFQVISSPTVQLNLTGNGCDSDGCGDINSNGGAQNIQAEIALLESDLHPLRIYPLVSTGISYRFGRSYDRMR